VEDVVVFTKFNQVNDGAQGLLFNNNYLAYNVATVSEANVMEYCLRNHVSQTSLEAEHCSEFIFYSVNCILNEELFVSFVKLDQNWTIRDPNELFYLSNYKKINIRVNLQLIDSENFLMISLTMLV
jgi:hypothetical protein